MTGHTKGPWTVFLGPKPGIEASDTSIIVWGDLEENAGIDGATPEERLANANLIAAAPDLLIALKDLCEMAGCWEAVDGRKNIQLNNSEAYIAAIAALKKANGNV